MTPEQKTLVETSFAKVIPISEVAAELFYNRLFELNPSLRPLFKGDMVEQGRKLMKMLRMAVASLGRLDELVPVVQKLGERHGTYGVKMQDYETVAAALLWTLEQGLGPDFTEETRAAWVNVYTLLASTMLAASNQAA